MSATLINILTSLGLTGNLKLCLDAGDSNSYGGSGQSWLDTSGNGYYFYLGATGSAEASDPTFNGTAGRLSNTEYWLFNGSQYFTYHTTNETWMENLHKANAKFTLWMWIYRSTMTRDAGLFDQCIESASNIGVEWVIRTNDHLFEVLNGTGVVYEQSKSLSGDNAWHCLAVSLDATIGANGAVFQTDNSFTTLSSTYTSPSSSPSSLTIQIGALGSGVYPLENNFRLGMFAAWEGVALTQTQLTALYNETLPRFGPGKIVVPSPRMQAVQRAAVR